MKLHFSACVMGLLGGWLFVAGCGDAPARLEPPTPKVSVQKPQVRPLADYDSYNGWIDAAETVELRSRVRGHIEKVHFTDGQIVKKGDLLFELDPRTFQAEINRQIDQKEIYEAQYVAAQKEEARLKELLGRGGASQSQVEKAEADVKSLAAQLKANEQEVVRKKLDLEFSRITSPISGRIGKAMMTEGNLVNAGGADPLLATIVSIEPVYIYFNVDERALQRYQNQRASEGQTTRPASLRGSKVKLTFGLETEVGYPNEAELDFADNRVDRSTGTILVRAIAAEPSSRLVPGSRVRIRINTTAEQSALLLPDTAILSDQDKKYVLVVDDKNIVQRRDVKLGRLLDDGMRTILPGSALSDKDWVITQGLQMARINYPAEPVKTETEPVKTEAEPVKSTDEPVKTNNDTATTDSHSLTSAPISGATGSAGL